MFLCPEPKTLELKGGMLYFAPGAMPEIRKEKTPTLYQKESYRIIVDKEGVLIQGADETGLYYGELTLKQIMLNYRGCLPYLYLYDEPEFSYRGFMIDSCRHFFSVNEIKKMIDGAAYFKFNKFHFHLSDDQGFRVEIESYPLLTSVGSQRPAAGFFKEDMATEPYGGYYTKVELREIVEYCRQRHIEVIPEFDIPGHTTAVISAYPELSCRGKKLNAKIVGGIFPDILCGGNPEVYKLISSVIDELCEIFPGKYFHIGGDEAPKTRWRECPKCKAKIDEEGLRSPEELQGYMVNYFADYLKGKGKKSICWNEAIKGGNVNKDNVTIALWQDRTDCTAKWANEGNTIIAENYTPYYADCPYGMHPLKAVYNFNPRKYKGLNSLGQASIKGVETPIWTEYVKDFEKMAYLCFPRWLAVAETGWNGGERKSYAKFKKNAAFYCDILKGMGINPAPEKDWDALPQSRVSQTVRFFKPNLNKETIKQFLHID